MMSTGRIGNHDGVRRSATLALCLVLAGGTAVAGVKLNRDERRSVSIDGQSRIVVKNGGGQTVIVGDVEAKDITIVAEFFVRAGSKDEARELMDELTFDVVEGEEDIVVETRRPQRKKARRGIISVLRGHRADTYIDYTIEVPKEFSADTWSTSGDVRVSNIAGTAEVHATSGDVHVRDVEGGVKIELTSGTIQVLEIDGDVRVSASSGSATVDGVGGTFVMQATSGDVIAQRVSGDCQVQLITGDLNLNGCLGDVRFQTSMGDASIVDVGGNVHAVTSSGNMDVMIVPVGEKEFVLSSSSGDIDVFFATPQDYGFLLDVVTGTGSIEGEMDIRVDEISRRRLKGVVGTGKSRVIIETATGNITIAERTTKK